MTTTDPADLLAEARAAVARVEEEWRKRESVCQYSPVMGAGAWMLEHGTLPLMRVILEVMETDAAALDSLTKMDFAADDHCLRVLHGAIIRTANDICGES